MTPLRRGDGALWNSVVNNIQAAVGTQSREQNGERIRKVLRECGVSDPDNLVEDILNELYKPKTPLLTRAVSALLVVLMVMGCGRTPVEPVRCLSFTVTVDTVWSVPDSLVLATAPLTKCS